MIDYLQLSRVQERRRRDLAELVRTIASTVVLVVLLGVVVVGAILCAAETAMQQATTPSYLVQR